VTAANDNRRWARFFARLFTGGVAARGDEAAAKRDADRIVSGESYARRDAEPSYWDATLPEPDLEEEPEPPPSLWRWGSFPWLNRRR
jgi:hypothetical protein